MENEEKELTSYFELLLNSPMFNLSLSSKELFHSNFLAWLWEIDRNMFCSLFNLQYKSSYVLKREYHNFDICIIGSNITTSKKDQLENVVFVLENKVKSIANAEQLIRYRDATPNAKHVLLSLATEFPSKKDIEDLKDNDGNQCWTIMTYDKLSNDLMGCLNSNITIYNPYHSNIIIDYCSFISNLHTIAQNWCKIDDSSSYSLNNGECATTDEGYIANLRIGDLREKLHASALAILINKKLTEKYKDKIRTKGEIWSLNGGEFKIGFGMTRAQGYIQVETNLPDLGIALMIQIQGNQYRHAICFKEKPNVMKIGEALNTFKKFINFGDNFRPSENLKLAELRKSKNRQSIYCKFGDKFIYRYLKIDVQSTKNQKIIDNILKDIKLINDLYINPIHTSK